MERRTIEPRPDWEAKAEEIGFLHHTAGGEPYRAEDRYYAISPHAVPLIERSWDEDDPSIYGRFDLAFSGGAPKMLEYNADTPTSLLEAAVAQWQWVEERFPEADQFNSIHEKLV